MDELRFSPTVLLWKRMSELLCMTPSRIADLSWSAEVPSCSQVCENDKHSIVQRGTEERARLEEQVDTPGKRSSPKSGSHAMLVCTKALGDDARS